MPLVIVMAEFSLTVSTVHKLLTCHDGHVLFVVCSVMWGLQYHVGVVVSCDVCSVMWGLWCHVGLQCHVRVVVSCGGCGVTWGWGAPNWCS